MNDDTPIDEMSTCIACGSTLEGETIERLNGGCFCISLREDALRQALKTDMQSTQIFKLIEERCPYLFSARPVFISNTQAERMAQVMRAVEWVVALPSYRNEILSKASAVARHDPGGAKGVFFGYDFHIQGESIGLIEINTNAGGAMLNAILARAQHACCKVMDDVISTTYTAAVLEQQIVDMFRSEWHLSGRNEPLRTIAIVDEAPPQQYLYAEFLLFQELFERHKIRAVIADPSELRWHSGLLWHGDTKIDLIYNRLTDFMLESPASASLHNAYLEHAVVLTPHPQAHALYADKGNLAIFTDQVRLQALGVPSEVQEILLANIPHTEKISGNDAERFWRDRRSLFFKPNAGYGGRAAYRGDKVTKRVWQEILTGDYVAQAIVQPGERVSGTAEHPESLKFDIRDYTYDGEVQWTAARIYQGQTTNFRTPGGGFAPVYVIADNSMNSDQNPKCQNTQQGESV